MKKAPFSLEFRTNRNDNSVSVGVSDASLRVYFNAYDERDDKTRDNSGVRISCRNAVFPKDESLFSASLCGQ